MPFRLRERIPVGKQHRDPLRPPAIPRSHHQRWSPCDFVDHPISESNRCKSSHIELRDRWGLVVRTSQRKAADAAHPAVNSPEERVIEATPDGCEHPVKILVASSVVYANAVERAPASFPAKEPIRPALWPTPGKANPTLPAASKEAAKPENLTTLGLMIGGSQVTLTVIGIELENAEMLPDDDGSRSRPEQALGRPVIVTVATPLEITATFDPDVEQWERCAVMAIVSGVAPARVIGGVNTTAPVTLLQWTVPVAETLMTVLVLLEEQPWARTANNIRRPTQFRSRCISAPCLHGLLVRQYRRQYRLLPASRPVATVR
jgi:hypothetical protein